VKLDYVKIAQVRQAQKDRMATQSWDYLDQNDPQYPELVVAKQQLKQQGLYHNLSVQEVRQKIKGS
jgi:hypothetical protein